MKIILFGDDRNLGETYGRILGKAYGHAIKSYTRMTSLLCDDWLDGGGVGFVLMVDFDAVDGLLAMIRKRLGGRPFPFVVFADWLDRPEYASAIARLASENSGRLVKRAGDIYVNLQEVGRQLLQVAAR